MRFFLVLVLFFLTFLLRIHNLTSAPPILQEQEIQIGLVALHNSISVPLAPVAILATIPFVNLLGLSVFSLRLPSVIFATLWVMLFFFIMRKKFPSVALLALCFVTFSPFFIEMSRIDTGMNGGLCFFLLGVYSCLFFSKQTKLLLLAPLICVFAIYADYAFLLPSIAVYVGVMIFTRKSILKYIPVAVISLLLFLLFLSPILPKSMGYITHIDDTNEYFILQNKQISDSRIAYSMHTRLATILFNPDIENIKLRIKHLTQYLEPHELFLNWTYNPSYITANAGLFYPFEILFFLAGVVFLLKKDRLVLAFFALWAATAILPAAITKSSPDLPFVAIAFLPLIVVNTFGCIYVIKSINQKIKRIFLASSVLICGYFVLRFLHMYYTIYPQNFVDYQMEYGKALLYEKNHFPKTKSVIFTDVTFGKNIYLYALFLDQTFVKASLDKLKSANRDTHYTFILEPPTQYNNANIYIQPTQTMPQHMRVFFTSNASDKKFQVSVFTPF